MYKGIRNVHLLLASFSLPFLLMYAVSAVQMSHDAWFTTKAAVHEQQLSLAAGKSEAREIARDVIERASAIRGELTNIQMTAAAINLRLVLPGTVHEVQYDRASGATRVKTSVAGFTGMLNRLHHAAGLSHESGSLNMWGVAVAIVSSALLLLGATGIYMWFARRQERVTGAVLLAVNLVVVVGLLIAIRRAGP
jgi:hypothetical protein